MVIANGIVYGRNWGFGYNSYPAKTIEADTYEEVKNLITTLPLENFDSGMGYETVMGIHYNSIIETIQEGEWTKSKQCKPVKRGVLKGKL